MLRFLASTLVTRKLAGRIARLVPHPMLRMVAVAATGYAVDRVLARATTRRTAALR